MPDKLYTSSGGGGLIKTSRIGEALNNAKQEGKLNGVPSFVISKFVESFEEKLKDPHVKSRVGSQITKTEVDYIIDQIKKNKTDNISDQQLETIRKVLIDQEFDIE